MRFASRKVETAVRSCLGASESITSIYNGTSNGLNRDRGNARSASICITDGAVLVGWEQPTALGLSGKGVAERFEPADIMAVSDGDAPLTGLVGALERKNATTAPGRAMGNTGSVPAVFLATRRGDIAVLFGHKERGLAREAMVAISDLCE